MLDVGRLVRVASLAIAAAAVVATAGACDDILLAQETILQEIGASFDDRAAILGGNLKRLLARP